MVDDLTSKQSTFQYQFNLVWLILTAALIIAVLFFQWKFQITDKQAEDQKAANALVNRLDDNTENMLEAVDVIPLNNGQFASCKDYLLPKLQTVMFNNPQISGVVISDLQNNVICSTLPNQPPLPPPSTASPVLIGPLEINESKTPVVLIQQRWAEYHIGIYLLESMIKERLAKNNPQFSFIGFYNTNDKKMLLEVGTRNNEHDFALTLQNFDNIILFLDAKPLSYTSSLLFLNVPIILVLLIISWFIYHHFRKAIKNRFSLTFALTNALKFKEFFPVYQPIWDEETKSYCGAEVLIRWSSPDAIIMPDIFIHEAEKNGLIIPITLQLIEIALTECSFLKDFKHFHLAFNLAPVHFKDETFFSKFYALCEKHHIPPAQIMLEMTERELLNQNDNSVVNRMLELRSRGHSLAIDDFGTGQSNLGYLQKLPFNYLKIDKGFISSIGTGAITETLNQSIINMAQSLNLKVIAEGVETKQQCNYLYDNGVNYIQGWYYAKAMSYQDLINLLQTYPLRAHNV